MRVSIWLVVAVAVLTGAGCSNTEPAGIHITGVIDAVYPISNGGTCLPGPVDNRTQLAFSANPDGAQAAVGWVVASFGAAASYTTFSHYIEYAGRTWTGKAGRVTVTATDTEHMSGTVNFKELREQNGSTLVNAAGSWTCRIMLQPTESPTPEPAPLPTAVPTPLPIGTQVQRRVLAPATVLPAAALCSYDLEETADGNVRPIFCRGGAINVLAWTFYTQVSSNVMSLGGGSTLTAVKAAMCSDMSDFHATLPEEHYAYEISAAYYGWSFSPEPDCR
jgi:hypothetical protein